MENFTTDQIEKMINASFDSVNLIEKLNALQSLNEEESDIKKRNIEHLQLMMKKDWFINNLSKEQKENINKICGNSY